MKKKILALLIASIMVICMMPTVASADTNTVYLKGQGLRDGITYSKTASEGVEALDYIVNDGTIKCVYDQNDGSATLYLNNIDVEYEPDTGEQIDLINSTVSKLNIVLIGDNSLHTNLKEACISGNNITVSGDGSLDLFSYEDTGIEAKGYLTLEGVKISVKTYSTCLYATDLDGNNPGIVNINGVSVLDLESTDCGLAINSRSGINFNLTYGGYVKGLAPYYGTLVYDGDITFGTGNTITLPENGVVTTFQTPNPEVPNARYIAASAGADPAKGFVVEYTGSAPDETNPPEDPTGETNPPEDPTAATTAAPKDTTAAPTTTASTGVKTGDSTNAMVYVIALIALVAAAGVTLFAAKKSR